MTSYIHKNRFVLGVDPGLKGAFVLTDLRKYLKVWRMPVDSETKRVSFQKVFEILQTIELDLGVVPAYVEKAKPLAMGSKYAFNYGRDFEAICLAFERATWGVHFVEPSEWTKSIHEGLSKDLKPKAKSQLAVKRFPKKLVEKLPKRPKARDFEEGPMDAFLIAAFGLSILDGDFF